MKYRFAVAVIATLSIGAASPNATAPDLAADRQMVKAERAFSALSVQLGIKDAFLANLCGDAIVFSPGPVNGRKDWAARKNPTGTLRWAPQFAEVATAGDIGYTTGPWKYTSPPGHKGRPAYGDFATIWKCDKNGDWCVAVDIGVSHGKPLVDLADVRLEPRPLHVRSDNRTGHRGTSAAVKSGAQSFDEAQRARVSAINEMMATEREYEFDLRISGASRSLSRHAASDLRFLRDGLLPRIGVPAAISVFAKRPHDIEWQPSGSGASTSGDLGYDYGVLKVRAPGAARPDTRAYLHVWRRGPDGKWKLVLDLENEFPKP